MLALDDEIIALLERIKSVREEADLQASYDTERRLICVFGTRARDHLLFTPVKPWSEFLGDM